MPSSFLSSKRKCSLIYTNIGGAFTLCPIRFCIGNLSRIHQQTNPSNSITFNFSNVPDRNFTLKRCSFYKFGWTWCKLAIFHHCTPCKLQLFCCNNILHIIGLVTQSLAREVQKIPPELCAVHKNYVFSLPTRFSGCGIALLSTKLTVRFWLPQPELAALVSLGVKCQNGRVPRSGCTLKNPRCSKSEIPH